jgi:hypothetical protein
MISIFLWIGGGEANTVANIDPIRNKLRTMAIFAVVFIFYSPLSYFRKEELGGGNI